MGKKRRKKGAYICSAYRNGKVAYYSRAVAEYDARVLAANNPQHTFNVFRCAHCRCWHIGRPAETLEREVG